MTASVKMHRPPTPLPWLCWIKVVLRSYLLYHTTASGDTHLDADTATNRYQHSNKYGNEHRPVHRYRRTRRHRCRRRLPPRSQQRRLLVLQQARQRARRPVHRYRQTRRHRCRRRHRQQLHHGQRPEPVRLPQQQSPPRSSADDNCDWHGYTEGSGCSGSYAGAFTHRHTLLRQFRWLCPPLPTNTSGLP